VVGFRVAEGAVRRHARTPGGEGVGVRSRHWGLWVAGHPGAAIALLVFSIAVNAAAELPVVRAVDPRPAP
jgi:hypothetical protein